MVLVAPLILLGFIKGGPVKSTALQPLIYGWVLQFGIALIPDLARRFVLSVEPASNMGGATFDPAAQAAQQAELLATAFEQGLITQAEADIFRTVHNAVEQYQVDHPELVKEGEKIDEREAIILNALVKEQTVTQAQADAFKAIHDRLSASD